MSTRSFAQSPRSSMTPRERFLAAIAGDEVDHIPVSVWLHFASEPYSGVETARLHLRYFREYGWDYLKVMNDYRYPLPGDSNVNSPLPGSNSDANSPLPRDNNADSQLSRDNNADLPLSGGYDARHSLSWGVDLIATETDLLRFEPQPLTAAPFAAQLECLRTLRTELGPDVPLVETLFSPVQTVVRAAGSRVWQTILAYPQAARQMLDAVTQTLVAYVNALAEIGVTALFYSVNGANRPPAAGGVTDEQFTNFIAPYDRRVLEAAGSAGLVRIGHIHGIDLAFDRVADYPVEAFNWSHLRTAPSLTEVRQRTKAAIIGGIDEVKVFDQTPAEVAADIERTWQEAGPRQFLVGPGCTVPPDTSRRLLHAIADAAHRLPTS